MEVAYVVIAVCFGLAGGIVGKIKGSSFLLWFLISAIVPVLRPDGGDRLPLRARRAAPALPRCGRVTKIYDAVCMRCGTELEYPEVAIAPESWERSAGRAAPERGSATGAAASSEIRVPEVVGCL